MLSIILYGRNDAHGYNLHKRAALSLNCIAASLNDPDDEVIFVDYNTPDELPTFPEAIADTLTDACKQKLRIIRVRPDFHRQFTGKTRLVALESQSRNIAARRANPNNNWLLSTNTDMIFCADEEGGSLTSVIGALADGFYHLPRFEVPEGFWERLDRKDPEAAITAMRHNGKRFHLNEIVWGIEDNLFEAPGDFQLFTRDDFYAVHGFDERMLLGWHVDSNIARRMRMLRGEVRVAFPQMSGYHCGHTRQATSLHGGSRTQNDFEFFVTSIETPHAEFQKDSWGAPAEVFEEVRLNQPSAYLTAMAAAVPAEGPDVLEAVYNHTSFGRVVLDANHALPHLCDLLFNFPPKQTFYFFGHDATLLEGLRTYLEVAGREPQFLIADVAKSPDVSRLDAARWGPCIRDLDTAVAEADIIILQNPSADMKPDKDRVEAEWWSQHIFTRLADQEAERADKRRFIVVNAIHTPIANLVESTLAPTVTPFSSRLRQGFVTTQALASGTEPSQERLYRKLGRRQPFTPQDRTLLQRVFGSLQDGAPVKGWERLAPEIAAVCTSPDPIPDSFGFDPDEARAWAVAADQVMRANVARAVEAPSEVGPRSNVGNRLLSGMDWEDTFWCRQAVAYFGPDVLSFRERKRWVWERTSLAVAVQQFLPPTGGRAPRVLVLANGPEYMAAVLTHLGYEIAYATISDIVAGQRSGEWQSHLDLSSLLLHRPLQPHLPGTRPEGGYDALMAPLPSLFERSLEEADALLQAVHPLMADGGLMFLTATVQMNEVAYEGGLSYAEWLALYGSEGPLGMRGFEPVGGVDSRVPLDTAVRFAFNDETADSIPGLSYGFLRGFNTSGLLTARWPKDLRAGPLERIEYGEVRRPDPMRLSIPYSEGADTRIDARASAAAPAAEVAAFLSTHPLMTVGRLSLSERPLFRANAALVGAMPYAHPLGQGERLPHQMRLSAPGGAGFILPVQAGDLTSMTMELGLSPSIEVAEAIAVNRWGGLLPLTVDGQKLTLSREEPLGDFAFAVRLSDPEVVLRHIAVKGA